MAELNSSPKPVGAKERIQVIDVLRGFAILGILLFNMRGFSGQAFPASSWPQPLDRAIVILLDFFVQAKFYSLFSFLFGWGMAVQMRRVEAKGKKFFPVYLRRMIILLVFGALHKSLLWTGDILLMYAVLGIIMLVVFRKLSPKLLLAAAFLFLVSVVILTLPGEVMDSTREWCADVTRCISTDRTLSESLFTTGTYWQVTQLRFQELRNGFWWFPCHMGNVIAMMLLGLYTGKRKIFEDFDLHQDLFRKVMWIGMCLGVVLNAYFAYVSAYPFSSPYYSLFRIGSRTFGAPAMTLFYITGITLLFQREKWRERLAPLALVGRMALTNYISHSIFLPLFFYGYGLGFYGLTDPTFGLIFTLVIYRTQIQISQWWFERFQFGPLEWLWRTLTYSMRLPFSIEAAEKTWKKISFKTGRKRAFILAVGFVLILSAVLVFGDQIQRETNDQGGGSQAETEMEEQVSVEVEESAPLEKSDPFTLALDLAYQEAHFPGSSSQDPNLLLDAFDPDSAFSFIETLSSPSYQGRYAGSPAGRAAGDYIAGEFARSGLQPVGPDGSYFQSFPLQGLVIGSEPFLSVMGADGVIGERYQMFRDYIPVLGGYAGPGFADGNVIWAVDCTRQDFHEIEVVDKVVFCRSGVIQDQVRLAAENDAAGVLLLADTSSQPAGYKNAYLQAWIPDPLPVFLVYSAAASDLLAGSGISVADLSILYEPVELGTRAVMEVIAQPPCQQGVCMGRNILALVAGSDPEKRDQVIILSANYDGLGTSPDGTVWPGANDNASGVSVLLEVARSWQEEGFNPTITVLFAVWDGQVQELRGMDYFLQNPIYPLDKTIALIHLDQVGAGSDILRISGEGAAGQIQAAAAGVGVETFLTEDASDEAALLLHSGLPFNIVGWEGNDQSSRTPDDRIDAIQLERLEQAGTITELTVYQLSEIHPMINDVLSLRCEAIVNDDLPAFLATSTSNQLDNDRVWFEDVLSLEPQSCEMAVSNLQVTGNEARGDVEVLLEVPPEEGDENDSLTIRMPVLFQYGGSSWRWNGPQLVRGETVSEGRTVFTVYHPEDDAAEVSGLAQAAADEYARIAKLLSLSPGLRGRISIYPQASQLKADTTPSQSGYISSWVSADSLKFASNPMDDLDSLNRSIAHLLLANHGIPRGSFPWLWEGLPLLLENNSDQILQQSDKLVQLQYQLAESEVDFSPESSWAAVEYIRTTSGFAGLGQLIDSLGTACQVYDCESDAGSDQALTQALQMDQDSFDAAWRGYWQARLDSAQAELDAVLSLRTDAVLNGSEGSFLATVDSQIPNLLAEEKYWFGNLAQFPVETYQVSGKPIAILDSGDILAEVRLLYTLQDVPRPLGRGNFTFEILFTDAGGGLLWAGPIFQSEWGSNVHVRYQEGLGEEAKILLDEAEQIYEVVSNQLGMAAGKRLAINLYGDRFLYRSSISLSFPAPEWNPGWTAPGQSIKLLLEDDLEDGAFQRSLAAQLSRQLFMQIGIRDEWILTGGSCYLVGDAAGSLDKQLAEASLIRLVNAVNKEEEFDLADLPDLYGLTEDEYRIALAQSCDSMRYFGDEYGNEALVDLLLSQRDHPDLDLAMQSAIRRSASSFFTDWKESFLQGHIPESALDMVYDFTVDEVQEHLDVLTDPALTGRQAGSAGSDLAADYIAETFVDSGLAVERQYFPVAYQTYLEAPRMELTANGSSSSFWFREDFLVLQLPKESRSISGQLIWIADDEYTGMDLDGKIAVRKPTLPIQEEISNAVAGGASALILVHDKNRDQDLLARYPFPAAGLDHEMPVIELTRSGFDRFAGFLELNLASLYQSHPAILLDAGIELMIEISAPVTSETSNIIGYLPGNDPELKDEWIIIGAHYDHVGDEFGTRYSGTNDNASGVAALLEMARIWHEEGYQPGRSVAFIAWGAQEPGELGSQYYLANPAFPLADTAAVLQMDAIGGGEGYYLDAVGDRNTDGLLLFSAQRASELLETRLHIAEPEVSSPPDPARLFSPGSLFDSARMAITSDDLPFRQEEIPTLLFRWQDASENNLPDSHADPIVPDRLEKSGRTILLVLMMLAR